MRLWISSESWVWMFGVTRVKRNLLVLLFSLLLSTLALAQTAIDGMIRDQKGKPVSGVAVVLQRAEGSIADQTTSNAEGHFRFSAVDAGEKWPILHGRIAPPVPTPGRHHTCKMQVLKPPLSSPYPEEI